MDQALPDGQASDTSVFKVHGRNQLADAAAKLGDLHVIGMNCVSIKRRAVAKDPNQTGIVRAGQMKRVEPDCQTLNAGNDRTQ